MSEKVDYKELALKKIKAEYEVFKQEAIAEEKTKEDVFNNSYENYVKIEFYLTFMNHEVEFSENLYYALSQEEENILHGMFEYYSEGEKGELNSLGGAIDFVENYCDKYYSDIMEEFEFPPIEDIKQG